MIMPLVIILTGMILYLTFCLYDRCVVEEDAYILAFRGSLRCQKDAAEIERYVMTESVGKLGGKYIGVAHLNSTVKSDSKTVTVEVKGTMEATGWNFGAKWQAQRICPTDCIRKVRLGKKIKKALVKNK